MTFFSIYCKCSSRLMLLVREKTSFNVFSSVAPFFCRCYSIFFYMLRRLNFTSCWRRISFIRNIINYSSLRMRRKYTPSAGNFLIVNPVWNLNYKHITDYPRFTIYSSTRYLFIIQYMLPYILCTFLKCFFYLDKKKTQKKHCGDQIFIKEVFIFYIHCLNLQVIFVRILINTT